MIAISISGIDGAIRGLEGLERDLAQANMDIAADGSIRVRRRLGEKMSDSGGWDGFFGRTGGAGNTLAARSGQSRARLSPGGQVTMIGDVAVAAVGSPDRHVAFLEEGGTISGRPWLSIPLASSQTAQGVDRKIPGEFFIRTLKGRLLLARNVGGPRSRSVEFLRILVRRVTLRGRHIFRDTRDELAPEIERAAEARVQALLGKHGHGA